MKIELYKNKNQFYIFKESEKYFIYDGRKGVLFNISKIIFDIINLGDCKDQDYLMSYLKDNYSQEEIKTAMHIMEKNFNNKCKEKNIVYESYDYMYNLREEESYKGGLWLNLAHDCNLRCQYCYADYGKYKHQTQLMPKKVVDSCINYWFEHIDKTKKVFHIIFFGGEPLMNLDMLIYTVNKVNDLLESIQGKAIFNLTTNGTILNQEILNLLVDNRFNLAVSIDGLEDIHNTNRPYASGKKSYKDIINNVKKILTIYPKLSVNMVVQEKDIPFIKRSVENLWSLGVKFVNVSLCIDKDVKLAYESLSRFEKEIEYLANTTYQNIVDRNYYVLENIIDTMSNIKYRDNCGKCTLYTNGAFVFAPNGDAYKCYKAVGEDEYKIANIFDEDVNLLKNRKRKPIIDKCKKCEIQALCNDGCLLEHQLYTNDVKHPAVEFCNKTKIIQKQGINTYAKLLLNNKEALDAFFEWRRVN